MASQATSTMDLSFGGYDDYPQMGGLVSQLAWEHDASCVSSMVGIEPADVYSIAPEGLKESSSVSDSGLFLKSADWNTEDDLQLFADLGSSLNDCYKLDLPQMNVETQRTVDASQASADETEHLSWMTCSDLFSLSDVFFDSSKNVSSPGSPDSGIGSLEAVSSPCSDISSEAAVCPTYESEHMTTLAVSQEDLALLESLWDNDPALESSSVPQTGAQALLTSVALQPSSHATLLPQAVPPTPESLKPSKFPSARTPHEKKQRKRAQNKNAATRYREKKREEAREIYLKQTKEEEKNKGLRDKVTLISREIEYMKELLIEVYRAKGIIE